MAKRKNALKRPKPIDPFKTYFNARTFRISAIVLNKEPQKDLFLWPSITCEAFALELHLKCLHHVRRRYNLETHEVRKLFDALSKSDKRKIASHLKTIVSPYHQRAKDSGLLLDIDSIITRSNRLFVLARYWHEDREPDADSSGIFSTAGISQLSDAIAMVIQDARPNWTQEMVQSFKLVSEPGEKIPTSTRH